MNDVERNAQIPVRNALVAFFVVAALLWIVAVVPFFLLGIGMFGMTVAEGWRATTQNAAAGDLMSIAMTALTLCLAGLPWALWVLVKTR